MDEFEWVKSFATSSYGTVSDALASTPEDSRSAPITAPRGSFASFVCHVVQLERKLRSFSSLVLDGSSNVKISSKILGQGKTFLVRHGQWVRDPQEPPLDVAVKEIISDVQSSEATSRSQTDWKAILFELRALLHEPIRYHPNLVRLLGIQWGVSPISDSAYPVLIMEYASLGTFNILQASSDPLSFPVKQKLCYDVGRALSALHASGIVHGDMKHENVLIFPNKDPAHGIPYTAKLADFGGTVMDMTLSETRKMETWTWPFQAPEITDNQALTRSGMMRTDVYSFGLLQSSRSTNMPKVEDFPKNVSILWPGFRPRLNEPNPEEFMFDPEGLKGILTWEQQHQMLEEMKEVAINANQTPRGLLEMKKTVAAFYVFQCYLLEFGTTFQAQEAVSWLLKASSDDDSHEDQDYFAQAWLWRISRALGVQTEISTDRLQSLLNLSVIRGHRTCLQDMLDLMAISSGPERGGWWNSSQVFRNILQSQMGAVGMGYFYPKFMTWPWKTTSLENLSELDQSIRRRLGSHYDSCIRSSASLDENLTARESRDKEATAFDRIYVNQRGHGLLHYAAAAGASNALRHMIANYECDVNLPNQHVEETPLVCACEGGKLDCALVLLEHGADPNGHRYGQEGPLHWLCSFLPNEMETVASKLVTAGADLELRSGGMRHDVRGIRADWEHIFEIRTTPLGRAVLMNNLDAVKVLLKLGANPLTKSASKHRGEWQGSSDISKMIDVSSPFELAAVLTHSDILAEFIQHIDGPSGGPKLKLVEEWSMLDLAHSRKVTVFDPVSLQSRLVRCGANYKRNMQVTLGLLFARASLLGGGPAGVLESERSRVLCNEVSLGNLDIVEVLLRLGYSPNGTKDFRPLEKAVELNNTEIFETLRRYKVDMTVTRMTPTGRISMLHVCASRPQQSRPGRAIADALIAAGLPVESTDRRSRPPFALAVMNQNFDVAQALLDNGANIDAIYPLPTKTMNGTETKTVGVLVEVLSQHTMRTVGSLRFLFGRTEGGPSQRPAFQIDSTNKLSILHLLAGSPHFTQIAQITPKILTLCLETYFEPELINYRHPFLGTVLYYAAMCGHKTMVELLVQHGADESYHSGPDVDGSVQTLLRPRESWTPLWAAIIRFEDELNKGTHFPPDGLSGAWLNSNLIQNSEKTIGLLSARSHDALAEQAIEQLQRRKQRLVEESYARQKDKLSKRRELKAREDEAPVDLGIPPGGSSKNDEAKIREICTGPEQEWKTGGLEWLLKSLSLSG
ncbi:hypothetical protein DV738_g3617, partial [Chaetothyriales sp. CBS 135597]